MHCNRKSIEFRVHSMEYEYNLKTKKKQQFETHSRSVALIQHSRQHEEQKINMNHNIFKFNFIQLAAHI